MEKRKMKSAVEVTKSCLQEYQTGMSLYPATDTRKALLEKAKELIIDGLSSEHTEYWPFGEIIKIGDKMKSYFIDYDKRNFPIVCTIAKRPDNEFGRNAIGDYKTWYIMLVLCQDIFPMEELKTWLAEYGWEISFESDDEFFCVELSNTEKFDLFDRLDMKVWEKETYLPDFMKY